MSMANESFYVPAGYGYDPTYMYGYGFDPANAMTMAPNIRQTIVNPVPHVQEIQVNELLPFRVSPTYTVNKWVVRSNISDRGALANHMLLAWRPEDLDYGSDLDTTSVPQVFLFTTERERVVLQNQLYRDFPELNLQSYKLKVPVRITTNTYPGANFVHRNTVILPGYGAPLYDPTIDIVQTATPVPLELPPEIAEPVSGFRVSRRAKEPAVVAAVKNTSVRNLPPLIGPAAKRPLSRKPSTKRRPMSSKSKSRRSRR
jgi:hypothetical protein